MMKHGSRASALRLPAWGLLAAIPTLCLAAPADLATLPAAVKAAADKIAPDVRWLSADQESATGDIVYELRGSDPKMRAVTLAVSRGGNVTFFEIEASLGDVPSVVMAAARSLVPSFRPAAACLVRRGDDLRSEGTVERAFVLDGVDAADREISMELTAEGKVTFLDREIALSSVPPAVRTAVQTKMPQLRPQAAFEIHERGSFSGYVIEGTRIIVSRPKLRVKAEAPVGEEVSLFVSPDGRQVEIRD
jgi:hypothetical protein